jgi:hypothetical protein
LGPQAPGKSSFHLRDGGFAAVAQVEKRNVRGEALTLPLFKQPLTNKGVILIDH